MKPANHKDCKWRIANPKHIEGDDFTFEDICGAPVPNWASQALGTIMPNGISKGWCASTEGTCPCWVKREETCEVCDGRGYYSNSAHDFELCKYCKLELKTRR